MAVNFISTRIVASDVPALAEFYGAIACASPVYFGSSEFAEVRTSGGTVAISGVRSSERNGAGAATPRANRTVVIEFIVDDVDAERVRLAPLVTDWVLEPTNQPWGNRSMLFRDLEGNLVNFYKPLPRAAA